MSGSPQSGQRVGFVGLGQMGSRMAARLVAAGYDLVVFDTDNAAVARLVGSGASSASSLLALADTCHTVLCSLPRPDVVEQVILAHEGLGEGAAVKLIVDLSTTGSVVTGQVAAALAEKGIVLVDAPISGGVTAAEAGTLTIMIAGESNARGQVDAILGCLGSKRFVIGNEPGLGQKMKLINNMLCAANAVTTFEALVAGVKGGLDAETMLNVINVSSGRSFISTDKVPECVLPRTFPPRFATELLLKDLKLGVEEARANNAPLWMLEAALEFTCTAIAEGDPTADYASLIKYFELRAGVEVAGSKGADSL